MHNGEVGFTLATGPRACGKSTLLSIVHKLMNNEHVVFTDTSEIICAHVDKGTEIGKRLRAHLEDMHSGVIIPNDELIVEAVFQWVEAAKRRKFFHFLIGGSPRSIEQSRLWAKRTRNFRVIGINMTFDDMRRSVITRNQKTGKMRPDENEEAIQRAWMEYHSKVRPGLSALNGEVLYLERRESLMDRVRKVVEHMLIPENVRKTLLHRLDCKEHPVTAEIEAMDLEEAVMATPAQIAA